VDIRLALCGLEIFADFCIVIVHRGGDRYGVSERKGETVCLYELGCGGVPLTGVDTL
jgi:hypothetical protein